MSRFTVKIDTDNAAFDDGNGRHEIAQILRALAGNLERGEDYLHAQTLFDSNGNDVGRAKHAEL